jgi:hypothetical protein
MFNKNNNTINDICFLRKASKRRNTLKKPELDPFLEDGPYDLIRK